jgi:hypothetical protein
MDMPSFKDVFQKLSVFRNNLSLLVPVIIAVVSVLLFIPTQLMSSKLKKEVEQKSINMGAKKIATLEKTAVSREQYEQEAKRQEAHTADANEIEKLARQTTQRELLSYVLFPAPDPNGFSGLIFQEFGQRFRKGIDAMVLSVNGRDCPTDVEIERGLESSSALDRSRGMGFSMRSSPIISSRSSSRDLSAMLDRGGLYGGSMMFSNVSRMIIDQMCLARAKEISVYVNPLDIAGYEYWKDYKYDTKKEDALRDCWYHQLAYWIVEDIFSTIRTMNSGYDNVLDAPVKRFMGITFTMGLKASRGGGGAVVRSIGRRRARQDTEKQADMPTYIHNEREGLSESCTARYCSNDIDVTHFNFTVIVKTRSVLPFIKELCSAKEHIFRGYPDGTDPPQTFKHNQISVLESKFGSIDLNDMAHRYYRYGDETAVSLDLVCEYIFDVGGYEKLTPEPVEKDLKGESETK